MNLSLAFLEQCSSETGFQVAALEKVAHLGELAAAISIHPLLGQVLALKGGTALNLCFGPPGRLSVDLDFNYTGREDRGEMLAQRPAVDEAILTLVRRLGYKPQQSAHTFAGGKLFLSYQSVLGHPERIELDINYLFRMPLSETVPMRLWQPDELERPAVRIVGLSELLIGKLLAFLDRSAVRDVWDVAHLPEQAAGVIASPSFRRLFVAMSAILPHPLYSYTQSRHEKLVTDETLIQQVTPMLMRNPVLQRGDLIRDAWRVVHPFLQPQQDEAKYMAGISQGKVHAEFLFPDDPAEASRIANHPALQWKINNVRAKLARDS